MFVDHIYAGDCRDVLPTLPAQSVDLVFADPPYNLQLRGSLLRPDLSLVDGVDDAWDRFDDLTTYDQFTREWLVECRRVLKETGTIWVIGSYHNIYRVGAIMQELGFWFLNDIVWVKTNPMPNFRGVRFTNAHETLLWCAHSHKRQRHTFNYQALKSLNDGLQMRSDWYIPICTGAERLRIDGAKIHTTQKPEALLYRVLLASSNPGDIVLDPFFGTGTTGAVARRLGRRFVGIEREERYRAAAEARIAAVQPVQSDAQVYRGTPDRRVTARLPFASLLEHGLLQPGQSLYYDGHRTSAATILADGSLRTADGTIGSIHFIGAYIGQKSACNGWDLWYYETAGGTLEPIDALRAALRARRDHPPET